MVSDLKHWIEQSAYLITIPKFYFKYDIKYWSISPLGQYINEILINSPKWELGIYIFDTENGDVHENVSKIFEFMLENDEDLCTIYTFSQCPSCKENLHSQKSLQISILLVKKNVNIALTFEKMLPLQCLKP